MDSKMAYANRIILNNDQHQEKRYYIEAELHFKNVV